MRTKIRKLLAKGWHNERKTRIKDKYVFIESGKWVRVLVFWTVDRIFWTGDWIFRIFWTGDRIFRIFWTGDGIFRTCRVIRFGCEKFGEFATERLALLFMFYRLFLASVIRTRWIRVFEYDYQNLRKFRSYVFMILNKVFSIDSKICNPFWIFGLFFFDFPRRNFSVEIDGTQRQLVVGPIFSRRVFDSVSL